MEYKVSVVVPVYNAEEYIEKCINSILDQTFEDIEIILINDCSKDNSLEVIKKYLNNKNIVLIDKSQNEGVSKARNDAIDIAKGEFLLFVDSDDWIEIDMVEKLYNEANKSESDMVICDAYLEYEGNVTSKLNLQLQNGQKYNANKILKYMLTQDKNIQGHPWNKLYRSKIIKNNGLRYDDSMSLYEDLMFNIEFLLKCNSVVFINDCLYHYIQRSNSLARTMNEKNIINTKHLIEKIEKIIKEEDIYEGYKDEFISFAYRTIVNNILLIMNSDEINHEKERYINELLLDEYIKNVIKLVLNTDKKYILKYHYIVGKMLNISRYNATIFIRLFNITLRPIIFIKNKVYNRQ